MLKNSTLAFKTTDHQQTIICSCQDNSPLIINTFYAHLICNLSSFFRYFLPSGRVVLIPFNLNKKRVMIVITLLLLILNFHVYSSLVLKKLDFFNHPSIWLYRHINHFLLLFVVCISNFTAIILLLFTLLHTKSAAMNSKLCD